MSENKTPANPCSKLIPRVNCSNNYDIDREAFREQGVYVLEGWCPDRYLKDIKAEAVDIFCRLFKKDHEPKSFVEEMIDLFRTNPAAIKNGGKLAQHTFKLWEFASSTQIKYVCELFGLEKPIIVTRPVLFFHNRHLATEEIYWKTPPHQDSSSICSSANTLVLWFPISHMNEKLGPLEVVPGSHRLGYQTTRFDHSFGLVEGYKDSDFVPVNCNVGDVVVFNSYLVHRSGENVLDDDIRWSINLRYGDLADENWRSRSFYTPYNYWSDPDDSHRSGESHPSSQYILENMVK